LFQIFDWRALLEIPILAFLFYTVLAFLRGSRGAGILRGLSTVLGVILVISLTMAGYLNLEVLSWLIEKVVPSLVLALIVIFQPELRSALVRLGQSQVFTRFLHQAWDPSAQIMRAVHAMSQSRTGALIALQRTIGLKTYTDGGTRIDAEVSAELLMSLFNKSSPLHDGAVVIRGDRIVAAACLFPLSENPNIETGLGTRHRAAIGVTEESDAVVIVVSEQTGDISVAEKGFLKRRVDDKTLRAVLQAVSSAEGFQAAPVGG